MDPGGHVNKLALAALLLASPLAARADIGLRLGPEVNVAYNDGKSTHFITDAWPVAGNVMLSYWMPTSLLAIDLELSEQFVGSGPGSGRVGTVLRPGVRFNPPVLPFYARAAIPINIETANNGTRETFDLRLGAGITVPLVLFHIYVEADADFPLGGGNSGVGSFSTWALLLSAGLDFRF
jgi:hypothetical protein